MNVDPQWSDVGLPNEIREHLVRGLDAHEFVLRKRRVPGTARGRPHSVLFGPAALDGREIERIAERYNCTNNEAIERWANARRKVAGLGPVQTSTHVDTWTRKGRRALRAWSQFKQADAEMDN